MTSVIDPIYQSRNCNRLKADAISQLSEKTAASDLKYYRGRPNENSI